MRLDWGSSLLAENATRDHQALNLAGAFTDGAQL
jgi:hypothetical protein